MSRRDVQTWRKEREAAAFVSAVSGATPDSIRRTIAAQRTVTAEHWTAVARCARAFDCRLVDELTKQGCAEALAANPNLEGRHLLRLALWATRASRTSNSEIGTAYRTLETLALRGKLARFPFILRELISRFRVATSMAMSMNPHRVRGPNIVLACPELPPATLIYFDATLVHHKAIFAPQRMQVVQHPSADIAVWQAVLATQPPKEVVTAIGGNPAAMRHGEIRKLLGS